MVSSGGLSRGCRLGRELPFCVSDGGGEHQLDLGTRIGLTPNRQFSPHQLGAFVHARQAVMRGEAALVQNLRVDTLAVVADVHPKLLPTCNSFSGANPKSPVAPGVQAENGDGREMLRRRRLPGDGPHTIEAEQTELRAQPEITVGCLGNRADGALGKTIADSPSRMRVLTDVERCV